MQSGGLVSLFLRGGHFHAVAMTEQIIELGVQKLVAVGLRDVEYAHHSQCPVLHIGLGVEQRQLFRDSIHKLCGLNPPLLPIFTQQHNVHQIAGEEALGNQAEEVQLGRLLHLGQSAGLIQQAVQNDSVITDIFQLIGLGHALVGIPHPIVIDGEIQGRDGLCTAERQRGILLILVKNVLRKPDPGAVVEGSAISNAVESDYLIEAVPVVHQLLEGIDLPEGFGEALPLGNASVLNIMGSEVGEHHIAVNFPKLLHKGGQILGLHPVVGVHHLHKFTHSSGNSRIEGTAVALIFLVNEPNGIGISVTVGLGHLRRIVLGTVIHHDDVQVVQNRRFQQRIQHPIQKCPAIIGGNYNG